jgi:3-oxoadipate enol-lactonase
LTYQLAAINGTTLHYQALGRGRPVVLIHAGIANLHMWDEQMLALAGSYRPIRYDIRGWGESLDAPGEYSDHADLRALLQHLGESEAILVGLSFGGKVALDFALSYPELTTALVLVGSAVGGYEFVAADIGDELAAFEAAYERGDKAAAAELEAQIWVDGPQRTSDQVDPTFRAQALALIRHTLELPDGPGQRQEPDPPAIERLAEVDVPVLVLRGEYDTMDIQALARLLTDNIPGATQKVIPDTAHLPNMERPAVFNRLLLDFLNGLPEKTAQDGIPE